MHFALGTTNRPKSEALERVLMTSPYTRDTPYSISYHSVSSWVPHMPSTLEEIRTGAKNRAVSTRKVFPDADYFIGMEGWVYQDYEWGNYWLVGITYIEDRVGNWHFGYSCHLEVPRIVVDALFDGQSRTLSTVMTALGEDEHSSEEKWSFGAFTDSMIPRSASFAQATECAIAPFFNRYYKK